MPLESKSHREFDSDLRGPGGLPLLTTRSTSKIWLHHLPWLFRDSELQDSVPPECLVIAGLPEGMTVSPSRYQRAWPPRQPIPRACLGPLPRLGWTSPVRASCVRGGTEETVSASCHKSSRGKSERVQAGICRSVSGKRRAQPLRRMSDSLVVCEVDESLKEKLKKFRFRKETNNAAILSEYRPQKRPRALLKGCQNAAETSLKSKLYVS
ncbi:hypothetical protein JZ751_017046 [Albula glossodonta]|uniref:Uncharacterized protein n=1 Tax=Albula glossodonta TaxID=121402 RepID=A0A8T2NSB8_9TELE|nr:hypothetical protein JZ751_017046 [Albula glossodonta]